MNDTIIYDSCTSKIFRKDITELCENCPLKGLILEEINEQIILEINEKKEILQKKQFEKFIQYEISCALKRMNNTKLLELKNTDYKEDPYRKTRIEKYIRNKEIIKTLNSFLLEKETENNKQPKTNPYPRIFTNYKGFEIFEYWHKKYNSKSELADMSYIYWIMTQDNFIHEGVKQNEFIKWLNNEYGIVLEKLKQLYIVKNHSRDTLYQTVIDLVNR